MTIKLVHVGFHNFVAIDKIVAISIPSAAPIKRFIQDKKDKGLVVELTNGRRVKAVIFTTSKHVVLAALEPETITGRIDGTASG